MSDQLGQLLEQVKSKDFQSLAKLLTLLDRDSLRVLPALMADVPKKLSLRIGITGSPGAGKSTLVGGLVENLLVAGKSIAVLAVDPSSPFSGGAILGDRIRYNELSLNSNVFIRSIGNRGSLGGLCAQAYLFLRAFELAGFDYTLIETVGVGQSEYEIMNVADIVSVVFVPESGDSIQAMKAGLIEIADQFIINKADRPGADSLLNELKALENFSQKHVTYFKTVAIDKTGVNEWAQSLLQSKSALIKERNSKERLRWEAKALVKSKIEQLLNDKVNVITDVKDFLKFVQNH